MTSQAPFEPTYRIFNFNTMPIYPFLLAFSRLVGIDGSFAIKLWPLLFWALSGSVLGVALFRAGLPFLGAAVLSLLVAQDPVLRWASVLVRPESLVGLCGMMLVVGCVLGFPKRWATPSRFYDPIAVLLAVAAYAHFNAVHLLVPTVLFLMWSPRRFVDVGWKTALYLSPWLALVVTHPKLFMTQMHTQWERLNIPNDWLQSWSNFIGGLLQDMGSPEKWPNELVGSAIILIGLIILALLWISVLVVALPSLTKKVNTESFALKLTVPAGWLVGACWLFERKPEVWFVYYIHLAGWAFLALLMVGLWRKDVRLEARVRKSLWAVPVAVLALFVWTNISQQQALAKSVSWRWETYYEFIDCIDRRLTEHESVLRSRGFTSVYRVWDPTFPDITIELSMRHPKWELTRTCDFLAKTPLALQHGRDVEAVVVPETISREEGWFDGPQEDALLTQSVWMNWKGYFLRHLNEEKKKKKERYLCQKGRWAGFIYLK